VYQVGTNKGTTTILFADDTTILFTHTNTTKFNSNIRTVFEIVTLGWKTIISHSILKKKYFFHFKTRNNPSIDMKIGYNKLIPNALSTRFLWLTIDSVLSRRIHIDHLTTKLNIACQVIRPIKPLMSHKTLVLIYHSLLHPVRSYRIIFWGNPCHRIQIFQMQKRVHRIITGGQK